MVNKTKAAEAAELHHDLFMLCSSTPEEQTSVSELHCSHLQSMQLFQQVRHLSLTYWCSCDVDCGSNCVPALRAWEGAGVRPGVLFTVWFAEQKRAVPLQKQVGVQFGLAHPQVDHVSASVVISQDQRWLAAGGERPGEGEILEAVRSDAWNGERVTLFLRYILWSKLEVFFKCVRLHPLYANSIMMLTKCTLVLPGGGPNLASVSWCERAEVSIAGEITHNPQHALHSEQTLVVSGFDDGFFHSFLSWGGICGPGYLGDWVNVVRRAGDRVISHLHDNRLD